MNGYQDNMFASEIDLDSDIAAITRKNGNKRAMEEEEDSFMTDSQFSKKSKPFQFSSM